MIIKETDYLDGRILVMEDSKKKTKFCKIIWKGFSATQKDENDEEEDIPGACFGTKASRGNRIEN